MPSNIQEFLTVVKLNNDEAKNKIKELSRETENWIKKREELMKMPGTKEQVRELTRLIKANEREVNPEPPLPIMHYELCIMNYKL